MQHTSPQQFGHIASSGNEAALSLANDTLSSFFPMSTRKVLLFQSLLTTLNGPKYLGARLDFPSLSSLM